VVVLLKVQVGIKELARHMRVGARVEDSVLIHLVEEPDNGSARALKISFHKSTAVSEAYLDHALLYQDQPGMVVLFSEHHFFNELKEMS